MTKLVLSLVIEVAGYGLLWWTAGWPVAIGVGLCVWGYAFARRP